MKDLSMAVVIKNGLVLVQKRFRRNKGMVLEFPGGSVDEGESGAEAAIRELCEETGIRAVKCVKCVTLTNNFGGDIHYAVFVLEDGSEPVEVEPIRRQKFYWLQPENIPLDDFYEADKDFIKQYLPKFMM